MLLPSSLLYLGFSYCCKLQYLILVLIGHIKSSWLKELQKQCYHLMGLSMWLILDFPGCFFYNPSTGLEELITFPASKSAADQRAARAGKKGPGKCLHLYRAKLPL